MADEGQKTNGTIPGEPPDVRDEAEDSPLWLPAIGLCVLVLGVAFLLWRSSGAEPAEATSTEPATEESTTAAESDVDTGSAEEEGAAPTPSKVAPSPRPRPRPAPAKIRPGVRIPSPAAP